VCAMRYENVRPKFKIREGSPNGTTKTMKERICDCESD